MLKKVKEVKKLNLKISILVIVINFITMLLLYFLVPLVQGYPPYSENLQFQSEVLKFTHLEIYIILFVLSVIIHLIAYKIFMQKIFDYLNKYYKKEKIFYKETYNVRKECINIPYKFEVFQIILILVVAIIYTIIFIDTVFGFIKFLFIVIAITSLASILTRMVMQKILHEVMLITYNVHSKYVKNIGYRITNSQNLLLYVIPFTSVVLIMISLIGYSKIVEQEGITKATYYKAYIDSKQIQTYQVNEESLKLILDSIPLNNKEDYYYIIDPDDQVYVSNSNGYISNFVLTYRDYFYNTEDSMLYESFDSNEQLYALELLDLNGDKWYIGFKFKVENEEFLIYVSELIVFTIIICSVALYIWAKHISENLIKARARLENLLNNSILENVSPFPITSNDEFGDLIYYYNRIQQQTINYVKKIENNKNILMKTEALASLGQLIGGISHNLKTPIMSISGAVEGLNDLIKEYDLSIEDNEVTKKDHHEIAKEMQSWTEKIKNYTEYMSDIITAVKGQVVSLTSTDKYKFTVEELIKRINLLMKHELKSSIIDLQIAVGVPGDTTLFGDINILVQVIDNMISNSIQAYGGKTGEKIVMTFEKEKNNLIISVQDFAGGLDKNVEKKLFKEMVTTKGKNGTGIGLYMSYATIKARFNGNITLNNNVGEGVTFYISIPLN